MYDRSIPTLAYVFIGLTSCVITYSHIMSNSGDTNNIDGMPSFVKKEIEEQQEQQEQQEVNNENLIENAIAPVETKVINDISENIEQKPQDEMQKPPEMEQKPQEELQKPPEMEQKPQEGEEKPQNLGGKKQKKSRKKKQQSRRSLREKKKKSKSNKKK